MSSMKIIVSPMKLLNDNINFMSETSLDLVAFLIKEMDDQELVPADITKRSGLSASQVSKILNRESPAGTRAMECFAIALNLPFDTLYRISKGLPLSSGNQEERRNELIHLFDQATSISQEDIIDYVKMRLDKDKRELKKNGKRDKIA